MSHSTDFLHLNLSIDGAGHHPAAWRLGRAGFHPTALAGYLAVARRAEQGKFDSLLLVDRLAAGDQLAASHRGLQLEPLTLLGALATATQRIGLVASVATNYTQPYNIARRLATLDHASNGRAGWAPRIDGDPAVAANYDPAPAGDRVQRDAEFTLVLRRLWDSWQDDARQIDKVAGHYVDTSRVQAIDHKGAIFSVTGPLDIPRPPQGHPLTVRHIQCADDPAALDADVLLVQPGDLQQARSLYGALHRAAASLGQASRILPTVTVVCSPSPAQLQRRLAALGAGPHAAWPPAWPVIAGSPAEVADTLLQWADAGAADGFNIAPAVLAEDLDDIVDYLVPELQQRGRVRRDYEASTPRGHYGLARPAGRTGSVSPSLVSTH